MGESTVLDQALAAKQVPVTELLLGDSTFGGTDLVATYALQGGWLLTHMRQDRCKVLKKKWQNGSHRAAHSKGEPQAPS